MGFSRQEYWSGLPFSLVPFSRYPGEGLGYLLQYSWASLVAQTVKNLPAMQETLVQDLGGEDSPGEGNGNLLQYCCLETGAWQAPVHQVAESDMTK